jgi:type IV secretory pathway VirB3-like protein
MQNWYNKYIFIKETNPRVVAGISSAFIGLVVGMYLDLSLGAQDSLGRVLAKLLGFVAGITTTIILALLVGGIYNCYKRHIERKNLKNGKPPETVA